MVLIDRASSWFSHAANTFSAAQLAAPLVRVDVVRIVRARAGVPELPDDLAGNPAEASTRIVPSAWRG